LSILWSFIFTRTKDSLVHWATEWDGWIRYGIVGL
jgi:hypothetical protein